MVGSWLVTLVIDSFGGSKQGSRFSLKEKPRVCKHVTCGGFADAHELRLGGPWIWWITEALFSEQLPGKPFQTLPTAVLVIRGEPSGEDTGFSHPSTLYGTWLQGLGQAVAELRCPLWLPCPSPLHSLAPAQVAEFRVLLERSSS